MHRQYLLTQLNAYYTRDKQERAMHAQTLAFVERSKNVFKNWNLAGHITGSAWVLDKDYCHVLLTHHKKLNQWFQLGGHSDGNPETFQVAQREALEESGLLDIDAPNEMIFDIDIHTILARKEAPEHWHYDIRFLFEADRHAPLQVSNESHALAWVALDRVSEKTNEPSIQRMVKKTLALKTTGQSKLLDNDSV